MGARQSGRPAVNAIYLKARRAAASCFERSRSPRNNLNAALRVAPHAQGYPSVTLIRGTRKRLQGRYSGLRDPPLAGLSIG
jgi:hypothetical protein